MYELVHGIILDPLLRNVSLLFYVDGLHRVNKREGARSYLIHEGINNVGFVIL